MKLKKMLENLHGVVKIDGLANSDIGEICNDSKAVKPGALFVAIKGTKLNGADFIDEAVDRGAAAVLLDADNKIFRKGVTFIYVKDAKKALAEVCKIFYTDLSTKMRLIAVTGTNGKTTITYLIEGLYKENNQKIGVIGTVNYRFGNRLIPAINTTPSILNVYSFLDSMSRKGIKNCVMEASSHSLAQCRLQTLRFDAAIFTNLTREHLDYHKNMDDYLAAKIKLFTMIKQNGFAIVNIDDANSGKILEKVRSEKKANIITYGVEKKADVYADDISFSFDGLRFRVHIDSRFAWPNKVQASQPLGQYYSSSLIGRHNVYNMLAAICAGICIGMEPESIKKGIESVKSLPGRLEGVQCGQDFSVYVDYAHTEDGMENVLRALRELMPKKLICIFGCGGDRDRLKRPKMGRISTQLSDKVFITSDNPRSEEPMDIINEVLSGIEVEKNNYVVEPDRFSAIKKAIEEAGMGDIVLIAGKGHETYQIFKNITLPFDDREVVKKIIKGEKLCLQSGIS